MGVMKDLEEAEVNAKMKSLRWLKKYDLFLHYGELFVVVEQKPEAQRTVVKRLAFPNASDGEICGQIREMETSNFADDALVARVVGFKCE